MTTKREAQRIATGEGMSTMDDWELNQICPWCGNDLDTPKDDDDACTAPPAENVVAANVAPVEPPAHIVT